MIALKTSAKRGAWSSKELNMRKLPYLFAVAAVSGLALSANPGSASPLAGGLTSGAAAVPEMGEGLVQKVHGWHCRKRWSRYRGWHRHRRACYNDYSYYPRYSYGLPFFSFHFFDDDRRRHRRYRRWKDDD
jgi:hypothetical protein